MLLTVVYLLYVFYPTLLTLGKSQHHIKYLGLELLHNDTYRDYLAVDVALAKRSYRTERRMREKTLRFFSRENRAF